MMAMPRTKRRRMERVGNRGGGDGRVRERHRGGEQQEGGDERKPSPIRRNERKRTPILSERDVRGARRHGSSRDSSRRAVARMPSGGILMARASVSLGQR